MISAEGPRASNTGIFRALGPLRAGQLPQMSEKTRENGLSGSPPAGPPLSTGGDVGKISIYIVKMHFSKIVSFKGII
jgi:hypothetical protein